MPDHGAGEPAIVLPRRLSPDWLVFAGSGRSGGGGNAFEDDDRECPVGVLLVGGGAIGDHAVEPVAFLACRYDGPGMIGAVAELDRHRWVGSQVVEPGRILGGARL